MVRSMHHNGLHRSVTPVPVVQATDGHVARTTAGQLHKYVGDMKLHVH